MIDKNTIPVHWEIKKLGEICLTTSGGTPSRRNPEYYYGDIPWVKSGELDKGLILDTEEKITMAALKNSSAKIFPRGTLLIALYGATIGKISFLGVDAATNQAVCGIFQSPYIDHKFLYHFLFFSKPNLVKKSIGGAQPNISQGILKDLIIPFPPISEQQQIVTKIEELFSELDKGKQQLETVRMQLKTYRQAVLKWAFEGRFTNKEIKDGNLPISWKYVKIVDIAEKTKNALKAGPFGSSLKKEYYIKNGYKIYGQEQVISGSATLGNYFISKEKFEELKSNKVKAGDVLISLVGTVGKVLILPENCQEGVINPRLIKISLNNEIYLPKFFKYYFESSIVKSFYSKKAQGTTMDVLNLNIIKSIPFPLCQIREQILIINEIETRLSVSDKIVETIENCLKQSESLRQSILKQAFEGKLVKII
jgi:type I restriction enzyme S subunit